MIFKKNRSNSIDWVEKKYDNYWLIIHMIKNDFHDNSICFELNYSGETGDFDFPLICIDIISQAFKGYYCFTRLDKPTSNLKIDSYLSQIINHVKCEKKEYILTERNGVDTENIKIYLHEKERYFRINSFEIFGYESKNMNQKKNIPPLKDAECDGYVRYEEMSDNLFMRINTNDMSQTLEIFQNICIKYNKTLNIKIL